MSAINKTLAVLAVLAFFLPFITISCNGTPYVQATGFKLAQCSISTCSAQDILSGDLKEKAQKYLPNIPMGEKSGGSDIEGANFVLLAGIASLVAAVLLFLPGRGGELLSGVLSIAGIVLLFMFRGKFTDAVAPHLQSGGMDMASALIKIELQFSVGFWLSMIVSAGSAILAFKGSSAAKGQAAAAGPGGGVSQQPSAGPSGG